MRARKLLPRLHVHVRLNVILQIVLDAITFAAEVTDEADVFGVRAEDLKRNLKVLEGIMKVGCRRAYVVIPSVGCKTQPAQLAHLPGLRLPFVSLVMFPRVISLQRPGAEVDVADAARPDLRPCFWNGFDSRQLQQQFLIQSFNLVFGFGLEMLNFDGTRWFHVFFYVFYDEMLLFGLCWFLNL